MIDPRIHRLANLLVRHSTRLARGEHVLIELFDAPESVAIALIEEVRDAGAHPHVAQRNTRVMRALNDNASEEQLATWAAYDLDRMTRMQAYIGIRGADNVSEMAGVPDEQMKRVGRLYQKPVHFERRVNHTRWCVLRWPTPSMAQLAQMSTRAFEDFYFDVCTLDYAKMDAACAPLAERMRKADQVHIKGPHDTDLRFSIKDIGVVPCCGQANIPDGECFTAPVRDSVNGVVHFNTPTIYNGVSFENVRLVFRDGKIVESSADQNGNKLNSIFDTDAGARYVGEFAIGFHPYIQTAMKDILFDEKIAGSFHFTPGRCYAEANNNNQSEIHWDLVCSQRPEHGGGEIRFDGEVIRKDGLFVPSDLLALNPDRLGAR
ncbi:MAG: aminopeptidase [Phycisphaerae bacterium]|nr:aminopeptidase [Phycisphaerae bacterium]